MKKVFSSFLFLTLLLSSLNCAEPLEGTAKSLYGEKFIFDNHSYVYFFEPWPGSCNIILHDPACPACPKEKAPLLSDLAVLLDKEKGTKKK